MSKDLVEIINNIDQEELGEVLMDIAEGLLYKDANIAICKISFDDLKNENFDNIEKLDYYEYGDWDNLSYYLSEKELERIKKQFDDDLQMLLEDDESDVDSCYGIFSSFLYCNDAMNDEKGYNFEYKDFVWCATD
jgi:hypothetical protein